MATRARGLRLPEELEREIERERKLRGAGSFSEVVIGLIREAVRMRRVPGIVFMDGTGGRRRAVLAGTGLEVWEIVATHKSLDEDYERLKASYEWLSEPQLRAALVYYELYPDEIDARLEEEVYWTPERLYEEYPFTRPGGREAPRFRVLRFLLDEDLPPRAAEIGRGLGLDASSVHELGRRGLTDREQLLFAAREELVFVTRDRKDYVELTLDFYREGIGHPGVLIVGRGLPNDRPERIAHALNRWEESQNDSPGSFGPYVVGFLS